MAVLSVRFSICSIIFVFPGSWMWTSIFSLQLPWPLISCFWLLTGFPLRWSVVYMVTFYISVFFLLIMIFLLCWAHALKHCNSEQLSKSCTDLGFCSFWQISTKNVEFPLRSSLNSVKLSHFFLWMTTIRLPPNVHHLSNTTQGHLHCLSSTFIYAFWLALSHLDPWFLVSLLFVSSTWRCYMKRDAIIFLSFAFYDVSVGLGTR